MAPARGWCCHSTLTTRGASTSVTWSSSPTHPCRPPVRRAAMTSVTTMRSRRTSRCVVVPPSLR
eukprot:1334711-Prymnesium_polylepis.1